MGADEIANKIIDGLEAVIKMKSPFPPEYQEIVYKASRFSPGSGFDQLLSENELAEIIQRLRKTVRYNFLIRDSSSDEWRYEQGGTRAAGPVGFVRSGKMR